MQKETLQIKIAKLLMQHWWCYSELIFKLYPHNSVPRQLCKLREKCKGDIITIKNKEYIWQEKIEGKTGTKFFRLIEKEV